MSKNITMAVAVDRETEERLVEYARQSGVSVSKVIRDAIIYILKNQHTEGSAPNEQV